MISRFRSRLPQRSDLPRPREIPRKARTEYARTGSRSRRPFQRVEGTSNPFYSVLWRYHDHSNRDLYPRYAMRPRLRETGRGSGRLSFRTPRGQPHNSDPTEAQAAEASCLNQALGIRKATVAAADRAPEPLDDAGSLRTTAARTPDFAEEISSAGWNHAPRREQHHVTPGGTVLHVQHVWPGAEDAQPFSSRPLYVLRTRPPRNHSAFGKATGQRLVGRSVIDQDLGRDGLGPALPQPDRLLHPSGPSSQAPTGHRRSRPPPATRRLSSRPA